MRITTLRRLVQVVSFFVILYIGFLGIQQIDIAVLPFIEPAEDFPKERIELLEAPSGYTQVFDTYLPLKTCRFIAGESRLFRGCTLHFFQESLTWLTPLHYLLPHILLFVVLCFLFGRLMCGWICPLGFISDVLGVARRGLRLPYVELPRVLRDGLVKFKYALLSFIILISLAIAAPIAAVLGISAFQKEFFLPACQMCPARILFPALGGVDPIPYSFDSVVLTVFSVFGLLFLFIFFTGFFVRRAWCRFCPSGALISFFNLGGAVVKEKNVRRCTRCGVCARVCPMQNRNVYDERINNVVNHRECIRCFRCVDMCPEDGCLKVRFFGKEIFESGFKG
jgi:polyferredoxin